MTIRETADLLQSRKLSPVDLVRDALDRIERDNPRLNAFVLVFADEAMEQARAAERAIGVGNWRGPLHGIPVSVKDLFFTRGARTAAGSKILGDFVPAYDAAVVERLRDAGAIIIGKTNLHELAYGITNNNPHFGATRNPWDVSRIPGGSSGGSGVAVAAGMGFASLGSDTGGSIRIPASYCGVTGIKASYGRVSRYGVVPLGWSLDHAGPLARTAWDAAAVLQAIAGYDDRDPAAAKLWRPDWLAYIEKGVRELKAGVAETFFFERLSPEVEKSVSAAIRALEELGVRIETVQLPDMEAVTEASRTTLLAEAAALYEKDMYRRPQDFGDDVRALLEQGQLVIAAQYVNAQRLRERVRAEFNAVFERVDFLVTPTTPITAPTIGETKIDIAGQKEDTRLLSTRLLRGFNFIGVPAISVPCGFDERHLPVGMQLVGKMNDESTILRAAHAYQSLTAWHKQSPQACEP